MLLTKEEMRYLDMQEKNARKYISKYFIPLTLVDEPLTLENTFGCPLVVHRRQCREETLILHIYFGTLLNSHFYNFSVRKMYHLKIIIIATSFPIYYFLFLFPF